MNVVVFIDYSDPLGGLLSWIADVSVFASDINIILAGIVTDASRSSWANVVTPDAPSSLIPLHPDEIGRAQHVESLTDLSENLRSIISHASLYIPNAYETGYRTALLARRFDIPAAITSFTHSDEPHYYYLAKRYESVVSRFLVAESRCYDGVRRLLPNRTTDIVKVPHGLRLPGSFDRIRKPYLRILYVGRVVHLQKRVFDLIKLAQKLRELKVPFRIDVIGDGEERSEFQRAAAEDAPEISCLGPMPRKEVLQNYQHYDCFVLCSSFEGMSIALMEAMAHGVVPVITAVGGAADLIQHGLEGFFWETGDVATAAQQLAHLWWNSETLLTCAAAARDCIAGSHNLELCSRHLVSTLVDAAANPRGSKTLALQLLASDTRSTYFPES